MNESRLKSHCHGGHEACREDVAGYYGVCKCGWEGKRRSVRQDAVLDANAHLKRHHHVQWYVRPGVKHQRSKPREVAR